MPRMTEVLTPARRAAVYPHPKTLHDKKIFRESEKVCGRFVEATICKVLENEDTLGRGRFFAS